MTAAVSIWYYLTVVIASQKNRSLKIKDDEFSSIMSTLKNNSKIILGSEKGKVKKIGQNLRIFITKSE